MCFCFALCVCVYDQQVRACVHSLTESLPPTFIKHHYPSLMLPGAEFHAGLVVSEKVEDHRAGLHLLPARREHEETEPDRLQHGGGRDRVRTPAPRPRSAGGPHTGSTHGPSRRVFSSGLTSGPSGVMSHKVTTPPQKIMIDQHCSNQQCLHALLKNIERKKCNSNSRCACWNRKPFFTWIKELWIS